MPDQDVMENPFNKVILVDVTIKMMGDTKKVDNKLVEVEADKDLTKTVKKIFDSPEYDSLVKFRGSVTTYMHSVIVPGVKIFKGGLYPVPMAKTSEVLGELDALIGDFKILVSKFCDTYDMRMEEHLTRLDKLANRSDYPSVKQVRTKFDMSYQIMSMGPPQSLEGFDKDLYKKEIEKIRNNCARAGEEVQLAIRELFQGYLDHLIESLTPGPDGKKKKFYETSVTKLTDFLENFKNNNITNDEELASLVQKCKNVMEGKDPKDLKKDEDIRALTKDALTKIKAPIDKMIGSVASRRISLED